MGKVEDEDDIPTADRGRKPTKLGFRGFDWWWNWSITNVTLGVTWHVTTWTGPVGYENGWWRGWHIYVYFLWFGCRLDWCAEWVPTDVTDPVPRLVSESRRLERRRYQNLRSMLKDRGLESVLTEIAEYVTETNRTASPYMTALDFNLRTALHSYKRRHEIREQPPGV